MSDDEEQGRREEKEARERLLEAEAEAQETLEQAEELEADPSADEPERRRSEDS